MKTERTLMIIVMAGLLVSCGPSEEEQKRRQQARQDSIRQAQQDSIERVQRQQKDSLAKARQDSIREAEQESQITFSEDGSFTVQVASWRSQWKAKEEVQMWKERGYENAFMVQHGNEQTGDVWYRIRLGRVDDRDEAEKLMQQVQEEYQTSAWISSTN